MAEEVVDKLMETAWGVIANAYGSDWSRAAPEWQKAAAEWRDEYFKFQSRRAYTGAWIKDTIVQLIPDAMFAQKMEIERLQEELYQLMGYTSATAEWRNKHPEEFVKWWQSRKNIGVQPVDPQTVTSKPVPFTWTGVRK